MFPLRTTRQLHQHPGPTVWRDQHPRWRSSRAGRSIEWQDERASESTPNIHFLNEELSGQSGSKYSNLADLLVCHGIKLFDRHGNTLPAPTPYF